jgi:hypothetical protein
LLQEYAVAE